MIGWTLRESWFQRRAGLVTLTATTAGGSGRTEVDDVPTGAAYRLAEEATPGLLAQFHAERV
ncbi:PH domain-containing protein [Nocardioides sambongensis]|uniref:PH domain-containing protein n=1 Tax=Nocardioides sambongensis TaxID=2589074 RepID=UPI00112A74FD|nr:PH domain-containing protein [Nocardioides sambongensis]